MEKIVKPIFIKALKHFFLIAVLIFVATYLQVYWAMGEFSSKTSSSCLTCSFEEDVFMAAFITSLFLATIFQLLLKIKNTKLKIVIEFLLLAFFWLFWDYTVFVERESSWSTYLFKEEVYVTFLNSILPILILSAITLLTINFSYFKKK